MVTHTVAQSGGDFSTIQGAIDEVVANQTSYVIISVEPGVYLENLVIPDNAPPFLLMGSEGARKTVIDGGLISSVVTVSADVVIDGFRLIRGVGQGAGINVSGGMPCFKRLEITGIEAEEFLPGVVSLENTTAGFHYCVFSKNKVLGTNVVTVEDSYVSFARCSFVGNTNSPLSNEYVIGIEPGQYGGVEIWDSIIWNESWTLDADLDMEHGQVSIEHSILRGAEVNTENVQDISPSCRSDGMLLSSSSAIDFGGSVANGPDIHLEAVPFGGGGDLGADEFVDSDVSADQLPDVWELEMLVEAVV